MAEHEYYLVEELAEKLRVNKMTIYRYIKAGKLKVHKLGKGYRISRDEYQRFIKSIKIK